MQPPLAQSFSASQHPPLPDLNRRKRIVSCIGDTEETFGRLNKTHHFHKYGKAIDAHKLTPPFRRDDWDLECLKMKRRVQTVIDSDWQDLKGLGASEGSNEPEEGKLLDLYVCCQCSFYCVASGIIPGVIPRKYFDEFVRDKRENPPPGKTGEQAIVQAFETILL
jgi:ubiquitin carboxyl-terminal hydrolase 25/28